MLIGEAAEQLGLAAHVLRHWEDEGVVVPARAPNGYRDYDDEAMARLRLVLACQGAGMALEQVRLVLHRGAEDRDEVIRDQIDKVGAQIVELGRTRSFLDHVLTCRHGLMSRCPGCTAAI